MKYTESANYQDRERLLQESIELHSQIGNQPAVDFFKVKLEMVRTHRDIQEATGLKFDVVHEGLGENAAAAVDPASDQNFVTEAELINKKDVMHFVNHELEHRLSKFFHISLEKLTPESQELLHRALGIDTLKQEDIIEGFTEFSNIQKHGQNDRVAYLQREVPIAKKLEALGEKHLRQSFLNTFRQGKIEEFTTMLERLCTRLALEQALSSQLN
ncbi:hypothetical protein IT411_00645 [Candidatus Peregrinibacteria bacterium]|nr:hypothetical protein [Candidatus Peregrinibacteria bacterium]